MTGSTLDSFLTEEGILEVCEDTATRRMARLEEGFHSLLLKPNKERLIGTKHYFSSPSAIFAFTLVRFEPHPKYGRAFLPVVVWRFPESPYLGEHRWHTEVKHIVLTRVYGLRYVGPAN